MHTQRVLVPLLTLFALVDCGGGGKGGTPPAEERPPLPANRRLVMIFDPTVLAGENAQRLGPDVLLPMHSAVAKLPGRTSLDFYVVGENRIGGGPEVTGALAGVRTPAEKAAQADSANRLGEAVARFAQASAQEIRSAPTKSATCVLTAIRRSRPSLAHASAAGDQRERVALVIVSDLMEACDDFGRMNFEASIPDRFPELQDSVDLSHVESVHILKVAHPAITDVAADRRLESAWRELLQRWGVPTERIFIAPSIAQRLFPSD